MTAGTERQSAEPSNGLAGERQKGVPPEDTV
jgi:hypothetical protein